MKYPKAKKLTAMRNFKAFGEKIGEDSLKVWLEMAGKKKPKMKQELFKRRMT